MRSQAVSPESILGSEGAGASAKATPTMNMLVNSDRIRIFFITNLQ
jgi:hypothetical protein